MIVLGVDPGFAKVGWAVFARGGPVAAGCLVTKGLSKPERETRGIPKTADKMRRADEIASFLQGIAEAYRVSVVAHEGISLGFHQATTLLDMGLGYGLIAAVARSVGAERLEYRPAQIKAWAARVLGLAPIEAKAAGKDVVIDAVTRMHPDMPWPSASKLMEHPADAAVCAILAQSGVECAKSAPYGVTRLGPQQVVEAFRPQRALTKPKRGEPLEGWSPAELRGVVDSAELRAHALGARSGS